MSKFDGHTDWEIDLLFRGSYRPTMENAGLISLTCSPIELPARIRELQEGLR